MINQATELLVGWSTGAQFAVAKEKEDEIKQGKNYYLSAFPIFVQFAQLGVILSKVTDSLPAHSLKLPIKIACNLTPFVGLATSLFCASVKQGDYENLAKRYHQTPYAYIKLPEKLSGRAVSFFSFFAEHTGNILRVATIASSIALIALGQVRYGAGALTALAYQSLDQMGYVARQISLFMEIYSPTLSMLGAFIGGTFLVRVIAASSITSIMLPSVNQFIQRQIDSFVRSKLEGLQGPSLKEIDAPLVKKEQMTFVEMEKILNSTSWDYKINPAHCSKAAIALNTFPVDRDFKKILTLFDSIDWVSKSHLVVSKLKADDQFIDFLFKKNPEVKKEDLKNHIDIYIQALATEAKQTPAQYVVHWMREQIVKTVNVLTGKDRVKGTQQDLEESIYNCSIILAHLFSLNNQVEKEDILLKIAIEGGDYCARGIKRMSNELLWGIVNGGIQQGDAFDPINDYETKVRQALQNERYNLIQMFYKEILKSAPDVLTDDVHGFDIYRLFFSLGFFPLTAFERNRIGLPELMNWEMFSQIRLQMYSFYESSLDAVIHESEAEFGNYLLQLINQNELLSDKEKEDLLEKFTECNHGKWSVEYTQHNFHRLLLVRMGVLIPL